MQFYPVPSHLAEALVKMMILEVGIVYLTNQALGGGAPPELTFIHGIVTMN